MDNLLASDARYRLFTWVKYLVYALLSLDVYLSLREELQALDYTFVDGFEPAQLIQVFSATIDTAAWVILLLLFELETCVLDDSRITGALKWSLHGVRGVCYLAIVWAFTGYWAELQTLYQVAPAATADACALVGQGYSLLQGLDEYAPLAAINCTGLAAPLYQVQGFTILAEEPTLQAARWLAWTDVFNAAAWILVCVVLEIEVRLQLRGDLSDAIMHSNKFVKFALYGVLFAAAAYWGYAGEFLDFWDAALWLFAFVFIELNVFEWQYETSHAAVAT